MGGRAQVTTHYCEVNEGTPLQVQLLGGHRARWWSVAL
jgi:hypothetical protein